MIYSQSIEPCLLTQRVTLIHLLTENPCSRQSFTRVLSPTDSGSDARWPWRLRDRRTGVRRVSLRRLRRQETVSPPLLDPLPAWSGFSASATTSSWDHVFPLCSSNLKLNKLLPKFTSHHNLKLNTWLSVYSWMNLFTDLLFTSISGLQWVESIQIVMSWNNCVLC